MKQLIIRKLSVLCLVAMLSNFIVGFAAPSAAIAAPTIHFTNYSLVSFCRLPDGESGSIASDGHTCCPPTATTDDDSCLFQKYIDPLIVLLSAAVGIVVVIAIIVGAIEFTASGGDPQRTASGKKHIMEALIGLMAYLFLYAFLQFIIPGGLFNGS